MQKGPRSDSRPLSCIDTPGILNNSLDVPHGGISDPPILVSLMHALKLSGPFSIFKDNCRKDPRRAWIVDYPAVDFPRPYKSFQSAVLAALTVENSVGSLSATLHEKAKITLLPLAPFDMPFNWFEGLHIELLKEAPYIKTCWLRTVCGAWCTSARLAAPQSRECIFGCSGCRDELTHYLICPILWQFARVTLRISEESCGFLSRVGIIQPTSDKFKLLAFCHALYHCCVNDNACMKENGQPRSSQTVQSAASELCNFCKHRIG